MMEMIRTNREITLHKHFKSEYLIKMYFSSNFDYLKSIVIHKIDKFNKKKQFTKNFFPLKYRLDIT